MKTMVLEGVARELAKQHLEWCEAHKLAIAELAESNRRKRLRFWHFLSLINGFKIGPGNQFVEGVITSDKDDDGEAGHGKIVLSIYEESDADRLRQDMANLEESE